MKSSILKPGYLVSLKTSIRGGISYARVTLEGDHINQSTGAREARWETQRSIQNPDEHEAAGVARSAARSLIASACCNSAFGLLCPMVNEGELTDKIQEARAIAERHNEGASCARVDVYVLVGRIAQDDVEAAKAIGAEVRDLLDDMRSGIAAADPERIREAANAARSLGGMLSGEASFAVSEAIKQARSAAREIVKRVEKAGELAADVVSDCGVSKIVAARFAFLDIDEAGEVSSEVPATRGLDLDAPPAPVVAAAALPIAQIEV